MLLLTSRLPACLRERYHPAIRLQGLRKIINYSG